NCSVASVTNDAPANYSLGATTVTWTVTDGSGNTATATQTVTVTDNQNPTITAPVNVNVVADMGSCEATGVALGTPTTADNCSVASVTNDAPANYSLGATTVTWTVTDGSGNTATATQTVTVTDNQNPTITAPANVNVVADMGSCEATGVALGTPTTADNCSVASVTNNAPANYSLGATTVTWTVTDGSGNTATATQTVTVTDNQNPTITAPANVNVVADMGSCEATGVALGTPTTADNCSVASVTNNAPAAFALGATTVTWTVTDGSGNTATATQTVTVSDDQNPIAIAQDITVQLDAAGNASISASDINNGSNDNCSLNLALDITSFNCGNVGTNNVVLTATDNSGNSSTANAVVTVEDNITPVVMTQDISIELDENGLASISETDINNGSYDNCGIASMILDITDFDSDDVGNNTVTLTVTDNNGNTNSSTAIVTVNDNLAPVAITQNYTAILDESGNATISTSNIDNGSYDNCGIASYSLDITTVNCSNIGTDVTVNLTVTDVNGNSSSATALVTVLDQTAPVLTNPGNQIVSSAGSCMGEVIDYTSLSSASDNCSSSFTISQTPAVGTSFSGSIQVTLSTTDESGNTGTTSFMVFSEDDVNPVAEAKNLIVYLDENGTASILAEDLDDGSTDNCAVADFSVDISTFDCSNVGTTQTVVFTVIDGNSNTDSQNAEVTVLDTLSPVVLVNNISLSLDENNMASIEVSDIDNSSYDNCGIQTLSLDVTEFDCSNLGLNYVTLTAVDNFGNSSFAVAEVTISDTTMPIANVQDLTVYLDEFGQAVVSAEQINDNSSDNCGIESMSIDLTSFACENLGENELIFTITDNSGNSVSQTATVTVLDSLAPIVVCLSDTLIEVPEIIGFYTVMGTELDASVTDNCGFTFENSFNSAESLDGSVFNEGTTLVTWTATDASGNQTICEMNVTIDLVTGIASNKKSLEILLYPNPANSIVNIQIPEQSNYEMVISDILGKTISVQNLNKTNNTVDVSNIIPGIYLVELTSNNYKKSFRLVVK
ncbi:MAG: T9SS type A sorting domain-containing protein, partial [Bacteroidales bacterium]|nr:T9SS type A sorting domain-containing protein [Bacteroidales bacterium]